MNSPGKSHRKGIDIIQLLKLFPNETAARRWFEEILWPSGPICPHCGSAKVAAHEKQCIDTAEISRRAGIFQESGHAMKSVNDSIVWGMLNKLVRENKVKKCP